MATPTSDPGELKVNLPAVCNACGTIFPSGYVVSGGGPNFFLNNEAGPCPECGNWGRIPDGVIDLSRPDIAGALRAMVTLGSIHNLRSLLSLLSAADEHELLAIRQALTTGAADRSEDQVAEDVQRAAPRLANVKNLIRNRENRIELATWLTLLAAVISIVIAVKSANQAVTPPRQDQIIQVIPPMGTLPATPSQATQHPPGRNERCPCGSGKKFKHCHGSPTAGP
jgi:uncharacterized protein YecA (UPF0149 family)